LIQSLTQSNQALLNQVRATDLMSLSGLNQTTGVVPVAAVDTYMSSDDRDMQAYLESIAQQISLGEEVSDEDLEAFRSVL
jgi:hypothetical protein